MRGYQVNVITCWPSKIISTTNRQGYTSHRENEKTPTYLPIDQLTSLYDLHWYQVDLTWYCPSKGPDPQRTGMGIHAVWDYLKWNPRVSRLTNSYDLHWRQVDILWFCPSTGTVPQLACMGIHCSGTIKGPDPLRAGISIHDIEIMKVRLHVKDRIHNEQVWV